MPSTYEYFGFQGEEVLRLLQQRKEIGYKSGKDNDGQKLALMFEGGAMGGIVSASAGAKLAELGYLNCFDTVYGTSSGALNAAYFVADQADVVLDVYKVETLDPNFMGIFRWPDQVNVKWLAQKVSQPGPHHLNVDNIISAAMELKISTTDVISGKTRYFSSKSDAAHTIVPAITASSCTPLLVSHRELINGREYSDGLLRDAIQTYAAVADGHTHAVALLSNPVGRRKRVHVLRAVFYNDALDLLHHGADAFSSLVICPHSSDPVVGALEKDTDVIDAAIDSHKLRVEAILSEKGRHTPHLSY